MFNFRDDLYVGPSITNEVKAKWRIRTGRGQFNIYLITLNHDSNKIEYFHNAMLKQKILFKRDYDVIGIAGSADECIGIVEQIHTECYEKLGNYNVIDYLK